MVADFHFGESVVPVEHNAVLVVDGDGPMAGAIAVMRSFKLVEPEYLSGCPLPQLAGRPSRARL